MITFKQFLHEAFDNPLKFRRTLSDKWETWYDIEGKNITVRFIVGAEDNVYDLEFHRGHGSLKLYSPTLSKSNQIRIFSTIGAITKDFIKHKNPDGITFSSWSPDKTDSLYKRFANEIGRYWGASVRHGDSSWEIIKRP